MLIERNVHDQSIQQAAFSSYCSLESIFAKVCSLQDINMDYIIWSISVEDQILRALLNSLHAPQFLFRFFKEPLILRISAFWPRTALSCRLAGGAQLVIAI